MIRYWSWCVVVVVGILVCLTLGGCAQTPYWERHPTWKLTGEVQTHYVDQVPWKYHPGIEGWAVRNADGSCDIYVKRSAENIDCVLAHERKHCEGWDHPKYRINLACTTMPLMNRL